MEDNPQMDEHRNNVGDGAQVTHSPKQTPWTPGPLTAQVSPRWPFDIETINADGELVFCDRMPAHSTAMRSLDDFWLGVGFKGAEREEVIVANRRALADATIRAAAPELYEALKIARDELAQIAMHKNLTCPAAPHVLAGMADRSLAHIDAALSKARPTQKGA
jgi:hypothetical protein